MLDEKSSDFASRLYRFRKTRNLTQEALGEMLGVSARYLGDLEKGKKEVEESSSLFKLFGLLETNSVPITPIESVLSVTEELPGYGPRAALKAARLAKGFTVAQFAKALGYSDTSTYQAIEDGLSRMGEKMIQKAAKLLNVNVSELMNGADEPPSRDVPYGTFGAVPNIGMGPGMERSRAKFVPLLSMAECGSLAAWDDGGYTGEGYLAFDVKDPKAFAVTLSGDSMAPIYTPGDVAIVNPSSKPRNGMVVIARLNDGHGADVMFKLFQASGSKVVLSSYNPAYPPMEFSSDAFNWIYPVSQVSKRMPGF